MRPIFRTLVLAVSLGAAATAFAQTANRPATNPVGRGDNVFFFSPLEGQARSNPIGNPLSAQSAIGRGTPHAAQVTPVPEPGEWAMLLAGLALVGFIVRRNSKR
jgi:hypothetical protein